MLRALVTLVLGESGGRHHPIEKLALEMVNLVGIADKAGLVFIPRFQFCHTNQDVLILIAVVVVQTLRLHENPELIAIRALADPSTTFTLLLLGRTGCRSVDLPFQLLLSLRRRQTGQTATVVRAFPRTPALQDPFLSLAAAAAFLPPQIGDGSGDFANFLVGGALTRLVDDAPPFALTAPSPFLLVPVSCPPPYRSRATRRFRGTAGSFDFLTSSTWQLPPLPSSCP